MKRQWSLARVMAAMALIAALLAIVFSSGLLDRRRAYLISHLGQVDGEKRSVRYGMLCYREHAVLPWRRIDAIILAQPQANAEVIPNGKVVDGTWNHWTRRVRDGQTEIGFENTMVPMTPGRNVHQVRWRVIEGRWSAEVESAQVSLNFDQAMLFLQVGTSEQWSPEGLRRWLTSEEAADVDTFPPPPRLLTPKPTPP